MRKQTRSRWNINNMVSVNTRCPILIVERKLAAGKISCVLDIPAHAVSISPTKEIGLPISPPTDFQEVTELLNNSVGHTFWLRPPYGLLFFDLDPWTKQTSTEHQQNYKRLEQFVLSKCGIKLDISLNGKSMKELSELSFAFCWDGLT